MGETELRQRLARLQAIIAIGEARVRADPIRHLQEMSDYCCELLKVLEDVEYALSPDYVFDVWEQRFKQMGVPNPDCIQGEAMIRCNKALKVIREYKAR